MNPHQQTPKEQTVEEAAAEFRLANPLSKTLLSDYFIAGAKWQLTQSSRERDDEEVKSFGHDNHLENCPFCNGSEKDGIVMLGYKHPKYRVSCTACGYFIEDDRKDKVFYHWSRRGEREQFHDTKTEAFDYMGAYFKVVSERDELQKQVGELVEVIRKIHIGLSRWPGKYSLDDMKEIAQSVLTNLI